ncbi:FAD-dependent oxidoreductase [Salinicola sp. JS01]|uniref:NAD(P)/FAD-dependent oxidoreductase n=1 Tax=Salinicola sp. JS01 TaxID=3050071 RepID=UPI00255B4998|nr:FAD-dependent oxidoreductase [Salinicola sp. JS01]WIX33149.1 FAD-dependent oxidoreductase [Salinicola sp. JS01]
MSELDTPLTSPGPAGQRIAVIGGGIAGMAAAHYLSRRHQVTLYEAGERLGGHTATVDVEHAGREYAIDTGFIVFNDRTYPHFQALLASLGVAAQPTEMSFSVHESGRDFEYNGHTLATLFAQRRNLLRPRFHRMLADILRFNRRAIRDFEQDRLPPELSLDEYLETGGYGEDFRRRYLLPMGGAIWSASEAGMRAFPARFFIRFFHHHGLLSVNDRPQWYTVSGGSRRYIEPLVAPYRERVHLRSPVTALHRDADGVTLTSPHGEARFDQVVLACHSDQALAMLGETATAAEREILGAIGYASNRVVLHTDTRLLPRRRRAWASWNYRLDGRDAEACVPVTYNMNILQRLESDTTFCVTLNDEARIDPAQILARFDYAHPQFTLTAQHAQTRFAEISQTARRTHFCGAYWRNGFHEDGVWSAWRVAQAIDGAAAAPTPRAARPAGSEVA